MNQLVFVVNNQIFSSVYGSGSYDNSTYNGSEKTGSSTSGSSTSQSSTQYIQVLDVDANVPYVSNSTIEQISDLPVISGTAPPYSKISITIHSQAVYCNTTANAQGDWSCQITSKLPLGLHEVYVTATTLQGKVINFKPFQVDAVAPVSSTTKTQSSTSTPPNTSHGLSGLEITFIILGFVIVLAAVLLLILGLLKRRKKKQPPTSGPMITPTPPPSS